MLTKPIASEAGFDFERQRIASAGVQGQMIKSL